MPIKQPPENVAMKKLTTETLANTNEYLKNPTQRNELIKRSVLTSTAVDAPVEDKEKQKREAKAKKLARQLKLNGT